MIQQAISTLPLQQREALIFFNTRNCRSKR
jgi:hypothetical protein